MIRDIDWPALLLTLAMVVMVREVAVWIMAQVHHPELGNLVGLFALLMGLLMLKRWRPLSQRLLDANMRIMKESALAFLPIAAGAGSMMVALGGELWAFLGVLILSTVLPLWLYARLAKHWL